MLWLGYLKDACNTVETQVPYTASAGQLTHVVPSLLTMLFAYGFSGIDLEPLVS